MSVGVLFVCLGNICRSPTAHGVFQNRVEERGLSSAIQVDSCGTGDWHVGHAPDQRAAAAARSRGYDLDDLRARGYVRVLIDGQITPRVLPVPGNGVHQFRLQLITSEEVSGIGLGERSETLVRVTGLDHRAGRTGHFDPERPAQICH